MLKLACETKNCFLFCIDYLNESSWKVETVWQILYCMSFVKNSLLQDISFDRYDVDAFLNNLILYNVFALIRLYLVSLHNSFLLNLCLTYFRCVL